MHSSCPISGGRNVARERYATSIVTAPTVIELDDQGGLRRLDFLDGPGFIQQIHGIGGRRRGYCMLVDDLLLTIAFEEQAESIRSNNGSPQPDAIAQKNRDRRSFPLQMLEKVS